VDVFRPEIPQVADGLTKVGRDGCPPIAPDRQVFVRDSREVRGEPIDDLPLFLRFSSPAVGAVEPELHLVTTIDERPNDPLEVPHVTGVSHDEEDPHRSDRPSGWDDPPAGRVTSAHDG
jgi:hypothetical protein